MNQERGGETGTTQIRQSSDLRSSASSAVRFLASFLYCHGSWPRVHECSKPSTACSMRLCPYHREGGGPCLLSTTPIPRSRARPIHDPLPARPLPSTDRLAHPPLQRRVRSRREGRAGEILADLGRRGSGVLYRICRPAPRRMKTDVVFLSSHCPFSRQSENTHGAGTVAAGNPPKNSRVVPDLLLHGTLRIVSNRSRFPA
jgi:hypothetical protein